MPFLAVFLVVFFFRETFVFSNPISPIAFFADFAPFIFFVKVISSVSFGSTGLLRSFLDMHHR